MKKYLQHPLVFISAALLLIGLIINVNYNSATPSARPNIVMETLDPSLEQYEVMWQREISRRFDNAVGVLVHGGDFVEGQWIVGSHAQPWKHVTPIQEIVRNIQKKYPGRTVVVLACNTGHLKLGIPGVYYAHSSVWCVPDRELKPEMFSADEARATLGESRWDEMPDIVGNIFEFQAD